MASTRFKRLFIIRFIAYFATILGLLSVLFEFGPLISAEIVYRSDVIFGIKKEVAPVSSEPEPSPAPGNSPDVVRNSNNSTFAQVTNNNTADFIKPVSTEYGIVIEKINANARVIAQIDPGNEREYIDALSKGVAEAKNSTEPGKPGNVFIFSHSTDAPWNIIRFNAIFYLLRELEAGDKVVIFYQNRRYDYIVFDKSIIEPTDVTYLNNRYDKPVLTLQTCYPPGTVSKRLIVRAQLQGS